jgi:hypothetical protein
VACDAVGKGRISGCTSLPIESYEYKDEQRVNNPPVGLVTPETDPDAGQKRTYAYDPHLDPALSWDQQIGRAEIEERYAQVRALTGVWRSRLWTTGASRA